MVIFLAALKGVPQELYEAAAIDGAGKWRQFFSVTVPLITPVIFYNLITQLCEAFQEFNSAFIITKGGPLGSTTLISLLIYQNAFRTYEMGLASAMAWLLFIYHYRFDSDFVRQPEILGLLLRVTTIKGGIENEQKNKRDH